MAKNQNFLEVLKITKKPRPLPPSGNKSREYLGKKFFNILHGFAGSKNYFPWKFGPKTAPVNMTDEQILGQNFADILAGVPSVNISSYPSFNFFCLKK